MENSAIEVKLAELTEQMKVANHRISDLEETTKRIESLTLSVQKLALSVECMAKEQVDYREKQNEISGRLLEVEKAPAQDKASKFDKYAGQIATLVVGALVGFLIKTFLGI